MPRATRASAAKQASSSVAPAKTTARNGAAVKASAPARTAAHAESDLSSLSSLSDDAADPDTTLPAQSTYAIAQDPASENSEGYLNDIFAAINDGNIAGLRAAEAPARATARDSAGATDEGVDENQSIGSSVPRARASKRTGKAVSRYSNAAAPVKAALSKPQIKRGYQLDELVEQAEAKERRRARQADALGGDDIDSFAARILAGDGDDTAPIGSSQQPAASQQSNIDVFGNAVLSPSRRGRVAQAETKAALRFARKGGHLGDAGEVDAYNELKRVMAIDGDIEDIEQQDAAADLAAQRLAERIDKCRFWGPLPSFEPAAVTHSGAMQPAHTLVLKLLDAGLSDPTAFRAAALDGLLDTKATMSCFAAVTGLLLHPLVTNELAGSLHIFAINLVRVIAKTAATSTASQDWPLSADKLSTLLVSLGGKLEAIDGRQSTPAVEQLSATALTDVVDTMAIDPPSSSQTTQITSDQRNAVVMRLCDLLRICAQHECVGGVRRQAEKTSLTTATFVKSFIPTLVRLSIDPTAQPLVDSIDVAVKALMHSVQRQESLALLGIAHAITTKFETLPSIAQYITVISLPGSTPDDRRMRRWIAWGLIVGCKQFESVTSFDAMPSLRQLRFKLGWQPKEESWRPHRTSPFYLDDSSDLETFVYTSRLLYVALSDLSLFTGGDVDKGADEATNRKRRIEVAKELTLVAQGINVLAMSMKRTSVHGGDAERADAKQMLKQLVSAIDTSLKINEYARGIDPQSTLNAWLEDCDIDLQRYRQEHAAPVE